MNFVGGCIFIAWVSGVGTFVSWIIAGVAIADNENYSGWAVFMAAFFTLIFMISGFFAASLR